MNKKFSERQRAAKAQLKEISIDGSYKVIVFHSASFGEFEQIKPVIELLKAKEENLKIVCTFFSPSGFETQKYYPFADYVLYLPTDSLGNARLFFERINPDIFVVSRYDVWYSFLYVAKRLNKPTILLNGTFPSSNFWRNRVGLKILQFIYSTFDEILVANKDELDLFTIVSSSAQHEWDSRFDRVLEASKNSTDDFETYFKGWNEKFIVVVGSAWQEDIEILKRAYRSLDVEQQSQLRFIIVPHNLNDESTKFSVTSSPTILYTKSECVCESDVEIVINTFGTLRKIYRVANAVWIGGGFGAGVHSVLEPAVFGVPLACGPKIERAKDAVSLLEISALTVVGDNSEALSWLNNVLAQEAEVLQRATDAKKYVVDRTGSTEKIAHLINTYLNAG